MSTLLTAEKKMELAIAKAKEARKLAKDNAKLALIENEEYIAYVASLQDEAEEITRLTGVMETVNKMKPIVTNDGTKYSVHCYPVAEYIFGPIMSRVIGLINASSAMFTDERATEYQALTGVSTLAFNNARVAIGSPAYFSKGTYASALGTVEEDRKKTLLAVMQGLNVDIEYINKVNDSSIKIWFDRAKDKADKMEKEFNLNEKLDSTSDFTLED